MTGNLLNATNLFNVMYCNLRELGLGYNSLSGTLPNSITVLSDLRVLGLGYNQIQGT